VAAAKEPVSLAGTYDAFKVNNAPRISYVTPRGDDAWKYADEAYKAGEGYMVRSDDTNRGLRWVFRLSDGRQVSLQGYLKATHPELSGKVTSGPKALENVWRNLSDKEKLTLVDSIPWEDAVPLTRTYPEVGRGNAFSVLETWLSVNKHPLAEVPSARNYLAHTLGTHLRGRRPTTTAPVTPGARAVDERMTFGMGTPESRYQYALEAPSEHPRLDRFLDEGVVGISTESVDTADVIRLARGKPDAPITVYRAVPEGIPSIEAGDWIALNREYAERHLRNPSDTIISKRVTANEIAWARTSDDEWLYAPKPPTTPAAPVTPGARVADPGDAAYLPVEGDVRLYRGQAQGGEGRYYSSDKDFARAFTQSGRESEISEIVVPANRVYRGEVLPFAKDVDAIDKALIDARAKGYDAIWVDEGLGQPPSALFAQAPTTARPVPPGAVPGVVAEAPTPVTPSAPPGPTTPAARGGEPPGPPGEPPPLAPPGGEGEEPSSVFARFLLDPKREDAWEQTKALRRKALGERTANLSARAEELIAEGKTVEDAVGQATGETMAGALPSAEGGLAGSFTAEMREALFGKIKDELENEPLEMISTMEALKNALMGKPIPRDPGTEGKSAWWRLMHVFAKEPEVMTLLETPGTLKEKVDRALLSAAPPPRGVTSKLLDAPSVPFGQSRMVLAEGFTPSGIKAKTADEIAKETLQLRLKLMGAPRGLSPEARGARVATNLMEEGSQAFLMPPDVTPVLGRIASGLGWGAVDVGNFVRANQSSIDFSWWRQQLPLIFNNKRAFMRANVQAWRAIWDDAAAKESWDRITKDPLYQLYARQGKDFLRPLELKPGQAQFEGVEEFGYMTRERVIPRFTARLPWIKVSNRVFVTGANEHNWAIYKQFYQLMLKQNERIATGEIVMPVGQAFSIEKNMEAFAKMLMDFTGRADLGKAKELAPMLSGFFFAPRFALGRILTPKHMWSGNAYVRKEAWKNLGSTVGVIGSFLILGKEMGLWDVELDMRSSDFAKIRIGNIRIDPWGGFQPLVRLLAQVSTNRGKSIKTGQIFKTDPVTSIARFFRGKAAPLASLVIDLKTGKTYIGEKLDPSKVDQWMERILMMSIMDIWDGIREGGLAGGAIASLPSVFGGGVSVHLQDVAGPTNREFNEIPGVNRLGIYLGIVPDTLSLGTHPRLRYSLGEVDLSEEEQKEYQELMASIVTPWIALLIEDPSFTKHADDPEEQERLLRSHMRKRKTRARQAYQRILRQRQSGQPQQTAPVRVQPQPQPQQQQRRAPPPQGGVSWAVLDAIEELVAP